MRPKEGILDPQGDAVRPVAAEARLRRHERSRRARRRPRARRPTTPTRRASQIERMCAELLANPLIESFEIRLGGVVRDRPLRRCRRLSRARTTTATPHGHSAPSVRSRRSSGTRRRSCREEIGAVVLPGGFSYGDYLRTGAIASVAPIMDAVRAFAAARRTGARHLQRLPDPLRGAPPARGPPAEPAARVRLPRRGAAGRERPTALFLRRCCVGQELVIPVKHGEGAWYADEGTFVQLAARGQIVLRYAEDVNGALGNVAGVVNEAGNVIGLMPHPEHAVDPLLGSADGGLLLAASSMRRPRIARALPRSA